MKRDQFQNGSLRIRRRVRGPSLWEFRYRVTGSDGRRKLKSVFPGTTEEYPTEQAVRVKLAGMVLALNAGTLHSGEVAVGALIDRFMHEEHFDKIVAGELTGPGVLHYSTVKSYLILLNRYLRPQWGRLPLTAVRPGAVQEWLNGLTVAPKTKAHIRGLLRRLFEKAILWELVDLQRNPIELVEVKGVSKRRRMPTVLTADQFRAVLAGLPEPYRTMVLVAQCTGLRVSEILALQWGDFDFERGVFKVTRAAVQGRVNQVKTEYSEDQLPLDPGLADVLLTWRRQAIPTAEGWVFPNPVTLRPYHASVLKRYLHRIGSKIGVRIGWHTFRHTYRSWLDATGAPVGVQQKLMRHAQVSTTMDVYGNALMDSKRDANSKVIRMALESGQQV